MAGGEPQQQQQPVPQKQLQSLLGTPKTAGSSCGGGSGPTNSLVAALMITAEVRKFDCATSEPNFAPRLEETANRWTKMARVPPLRS
jgi:hypothetical protein